MMGKQIHIYVHDGRQQGKTLRRTRDAAPQLEEAARKYKHVGEVQTALSILNKPVYGGIAKAEAKWQHAGEVNRALNVLRKYAEFGINDASAAFTAAARELAVLGLQLKQQDGEYQVKFKGSNETGYFTNDLTDAVATGKDMARRAIRHS